MAKKTCVICGEAGYSYFPFCYKHLQEKNEGKITKCEDCGKWHNIKDECSCKVTKQIETTVAEDNKIVSDNKTTKCILCENLSENQLFCKSCYYKYKNKELLIKIKGCKEVELLDDSYEGRYICSDGHIVKSKSEREIDNYLYREKISHAYEKALPINEKREDDLHPDFYLPEKDLYIEHWGFDETNKPYTKTKEYKTEHYQRLGITLINTYEKTDMGDIETNLKRKLDTYLKGKINFDD